MQLLPSNRFVPLTILCLVLGSSSGANYHVFDDASWAVASPKLSDQLGGHRQAAYDDYIRNCRASNVSKNCHLDEARRLEMNAKQPGSVYNFTEMGFLKTKAPDNIRKLVEAFWNKNRLSNHSEGTKAIVYHNTWETMPDFLPLYNEALEGGGPNLVAVIAEGVRNAIEEWTGMQSSVTSVYGIRIYRNNSVLTPHVDRLPLISSAIINVAQDVDEPWPLEVYGHDGQAYNVTMEPWDMVLYESHSVIHGRPFPLRGNYYANMFVHFEALCPVGQYNCEGKDLPPYIVPGSAWEQDFRTQFPNGRRLDAMKLARDGDLKGLRYLAKADPKRVRERDYNGWEPIHMAARYGYLDMVKFLVEEHGIPVTVKSDKGHSMLDIVRSYPSGKEALIDYLTKATAAVKEEL